MSTWLEIPVVRTPPFFPYGAGFPDAFRNTFDNLLKKIIPIKKKFRMIDKIAVQDGDHPGLVRSFQVTIDDGIAARLLKTIEDRVELAPPRITPSGKTLQDHHKINIRIRPVPATSNR